MSRKKARFTGASDGGHPLTGQRVVFCICTPRRLREWFETFSVDNKIACLKELEERFVKEGSYVDGMCICKMKNNPRWRARAEAEKARVGGLEDLEFDDDNSNHDDSDKEWDGMEAVFQKLKLDD